MVIVATGPLFTKDGLFLGFSLYGSEFVSLHLEVQIWCLIILEKVLGRRRSDVGIIAVPLQMALNQAAACIDRGFGPFPVLEPLVLLLGLAYL